MNDLWLYLRGFTFNNKHNTSIGVVMHSKSIQSPSKKKIKESVPFMNGSYDFSTVGTNGEIVYTEREITVELGLPAFTKEQLQTLYTTVAEWLLDVGKCQLIFDDAKGYFYMAEVEKIDNFEQVMEFGKMSITFIAEPFKFGIDYAGDNLWDTFNFEEDALQIMEFDVVDSLTINIYNPQRIVVPIINTNAQMSVKIGTYTANLISGNNKNYGFKLQNGSNSIDITGTGHIKFLFRKQAI